MANLNEYGKLIQKYENKININFVLVYISEAHPSDGWIYKNNVQIKQHKNMNNRIDACKLLINLWTKQQQFIKHYIANNKLNIFVDTMSNDIARIFGAWPERFVIINDNFKVVFKGGYGPLNYSVKAVEQFVTKYDN
eukprot:45071_1